MKIIAIASAISVVALTFGVGSTPAYATCQNGAEDFPTCTPTTTSTATPATTTTVPDPVSTTSTPPTSSTTTSTSTAPTSTESPSTTEAPSTSTAPSTSDAPAATTSPPSTTAPTTLIPPTSQPGPDPTVELPATGSTINNLATLAIVALIAGAFFVCVARRERVTS